jgi:hypothetical protein|tara:strand:+ start:36 stop:554 length:519 start_codon:yes stop_codon:yes gene_type:complete
MKFYKLLALTIIAILALNSCKALKPKWVDTRNVPTDARERARKNVEEGRGVSLGNLGNRKTTYQFSSSNPMWRASLEVLDFIPLTTVDYSGGVIITDWYNDNAGNDAIKVTVRFLSNEVRTNSIKVVVHKKTCDNNQNCATNKIDSKIEEELVTSILKLAAKFEKETKTKKN